MFPTRGHWHGPGGICGALLEMKFLEMRKEIKGRRRRRRKKGLIIMISGCMIDGFG